MRAPGPRIMWLRSSSDGGIRCRADSRQKEQTLQLEPDHLHNTPPEKCHVPIYHNFINYSGALVFTRCFTLDRKQMSVKSIAVIFTDLWMDENVVESGFCETESSSARCLHNACHTPNEQSVRRERDVVNAITSKPVSVRRTLNADDAITAENI